MQIHVTDCTFGRHQRDIHLPYVGAAGYGSKAMAIMIISLQPLGWVCTLIRKWCCKQLVPFVMVKSLWPVTRWHLSLVPVMSVNQYSRLHVITSTRMPKIPGTDWWIVNTLSTFEVMHSSTIIRSRNKCVIQLRRMHDRQRIDHYPLAKITQGNKYGGIAWKQKSHCESILLWNYMQQHAVDSNGASCTVGRNS